MTVAEGQRPGQRARRPRCARRWCRSFPSSSAIRLTDYKVRILTPQDAHQGGDAGDDRKRRRGRRRRWSTVGVSSDIINASYNALHDSLTYKLWRAGRRA